MLLKLNILEEHILHGFITEEQLLWRLRRKGKYQTRGENRRYLEKYISNGIG